MEYSQENLTPIKKKFTVQNTSEEVDAAIKNQIRHIKQNVNMPGFRLGKAPDSLIAKKFASDIKEEAENAILQSSLTEIIEKENPRPINNYIISKPKNFEKGQPIEWSFEFEEMPQFDLPEYRGLKGEITKTVVSDADIERSINTFKSYTAARIPAKDDSPARNGQLANINVDILEDGVSIPEFALRNYNIIVGKDFLVPDVDEIVRGLPVGNVAEREISFPADFPNAKLAGETRQARVKINAVYNLDHSGWDKNIGNSEESKEYSNLAQLIRTAQTAEKSELNKNIAEAALLDQLLKQTDFPVPETLTDFEFKRILSEYNEHLRSRGMSLGALGEKLESTIEQARESAKKSAAQQTLLLAIAAKENLQLEENELIAAIEDYSKENGEDFQASLRSLQQNGMLNFLKNKLLADKAMDLVYENAEMTEVEPETDNAKTGQE